MLAWRIAKAAYALDRLGTGARLTGGRWNSEGVAAVYGGMSPAISALEKLVHTGDILPPDLVLVEIALPDDADLYETLDRSSLPEGWDDLPSSAQAMAVGDQFIETGRKLGLIVPSAIIPESKNIVINPHHPAMMQVHFRILREFKFDPRLRLLPRQ